MPPLGVAATAPLQSPVQETPNPLKLVVTAGFAIITEGCVKVTIVVVIQP